MRRGPVRRWLVPVAVAVASIGCSRIVLAQQRLAPPDSVALQTRSRMLVLSPRTTREFWSLLTASAPGALHGLVWMPAHPSLHQRAQLREAGVTILSSVQGRIYRVRVASTADTSRAPLMPLLLAALQPVDRVAPALWRGDTAAFAIVETDGRRTNNVINGDGTANVIVRVHVGTPTALAESILRARAVEIRRMSDSRWLAVVPLAGIRALAEADVIQWIDAVPVAVTSDNDVTRVAVNADVVQGFDVTTGVATGLGGLGIRVGLFDDGLDEGHGDFGSRIVHNATGRTTHGTHVAGVLAADGTMSAKPDSWGTMNGGSPHQWRGIAPQAELIDAWKHESANAGIHLFYVTGLGMALSNHSYSFAYDGDYGPWDAAHDELVRGDAAYGGVAIPPRLFVYSTGNQGKTPAYPGEQVGYFSLTKQAKNGLIVGNFDHVQAHISPLGSLGPAHDGRIKPDVVAPGTDARSTGFCAVPSTLCTGAPSGATSRTGFYFPWTGSSLAAPVVTGVLALVLQQLEQNAPEGLGQNAGLLGAHPLPSTLRAIAVQSARDVDGGPSFPNADGSVRALPGPDFVTGYGLVDAQAAVQIAAERRMIEDVIGSTCGLRSWWVRVENGSSPLIVTLAWDDPPADPLSPHTDRKLINDLDLELRAPGTGEAHYPWLLDQRAVDAAGNEVPASAQVCGSDLVVQRGLLPNPAPNFDATDPSKNKNDVVTDALLQPAGRGRDHLNNIEQVRVDDPAPGWWLVRVTGFAVPDGPQSFSLVGSSRPQFLYRFPVFCESWKELCAAVLRPQLHVLCARVPELCEPIRIPFRADTIPIRFRHSSDRMLIPLGDACRFVVRCPPCARDGQCPALELAFPAVPSQVSLSVHDRAGRRMPVHDVGRGVRRVRIDAGSGRDYVLVIAPARGARIGREYVLPMSARASGNPR